MKLLLDSVNNSNSNICGKPCGATKYHVARPNIMWRDQISCGATKYHVVRPNIMWCMSVFHYRYVPDWQFWCFYIQLMVYIHKILYFNIIWNICLCNLGHFGQFMFNLCTA